MPIQSPITRHYRSLAANTSDDYVRQHLAAIADSLAAHGIASRLERIGTISTLTIDQSGTEPDDDTITVDPDPNGGFGLHLDCTCTWTPRPGATPQATAAIITAVLHALRSTPERA